MVSALLRHTGLRTVGLAVLAIAAVIGLSVPLTPGNGADAAGDGYDVSNWTDPDGNAHRIRWNPCQQKVTYAVNARLAGKTPKARNAAIDDVRAAFHRAGKRTGIPFSYRGRTREIPHNTDKASWATRQHSAEIVVAWVDQSRPKTHSDLITKGTDGYGSGVGGWMLRAWADANGKWHAAIGRGFVVLNSAQNHLYTPGFGTGVRRGALLLHEIGHAMGLGHVGTTREIMYPTMIRREHSNYKHGDQQGLSLVGKRLGCIPGATGIWPQI